jgi:hypothetical protein
MNISGHQRCSEKCDSNAQGYSKRGVLYMVLIVASLLKQSTLKVTPLIKLYIYSNVCSNSIQEHNSQILHKCTCYILFRFLSTSDFLHMLALFSTFGNSAVCIFYHYYEHSSCNRTFWWIQGFYDTKMLCTGR